MLTKTREYGVIEAVFREENLQRIKNADPNILFELLSLHRLFPLVSDGFYGLFDDAVIMQLKDRKRNLSITSLTLARVLEEVKDHITKSGYGIITIKGPVLALTLFGDVGQRHFGDLDLVVKREDVLKVVSILEGLGYKMISPKLGLSEKQWDYYFRYKKDVGLVNREIGVFIELHVGVYRHELLRAAEEVMMWEDLEEVVIGKTPIKTMSRDNTFLYLLYHGGQHLYFRLFWLRDVAEAIKRWDIDHQKVLDNGLTLGIDRMVGLGLLLAKELFEVPVPEAYNEYLVQHKRILEKLKRLCLLKIYGPEKDTFIWKLRRFRFNMMLKAGLKYKWAVISSLFHRWYIRKYLGGH